MAEVEVSEARMGVTVRDVAAYEFIVGYAHHLKKSRKFVLPKWVDLVKTGVRKELAPYDPDWYYIRAASVARKIYLHKGLGIGGLRRWYGGRHRRGTLPETFAKAAGGILRHIVKQLESMKVVEINEKGGRVITRIGQQELDLIASQV